MCSLPLFPLEISWSLITGYNNSQEIKISWAIAVTSNVPHPRKELSPDTCPLFFHTFSHSFLYLFPFHLWWDWEKGKRRLYVIWNVLIEVWTPVSLRKLNWPAVMSPHTKLSDLLHLTLISQAPDWAWYCRQASSSPLTSVDSYSGHAEPFEMYASEDRDAVLESYHRGRKCRLEKSCWLLCSSSFPH